MRARARRRDLVARLFERCREVDRVERFPLLVVVRPKRVGDPPAGQREACVMLDRPLEAPDCLLMVERVGPHKSTVEPRLGARRGCRRPTRVGAEIEVGFHRCRFRSELSHVCTAPGARPVTRRPPGQCRSPVNCRCSTRWHRSRPAQLTASPMPPRLAKDLPDAAPGPPSGSRRSDRSDATPSRILASRLHPAHSGSVRKPASWSTPGEMLGSAAHNAMPHNDATPFAGGRTERHVRGRAARRGFGGVR